MYSLHDFFYFIFFSKKRLVLSDPNDFSGVIDSGKYNMERKRNKNLKLTIETLFKTWFLLFFGCLFHLYREKSVLCHCDVKKFDLCVFLFFSFFESSWGSQFKHFMWNFIYFYFFSPTLMHGNDNNNRESLLFSGVFYFIAQSLFIVPLAQDRIHFYRCNHHMALNLTLHCLWRKIRFILVS